MSSAIQVLENIYVYPSLLYTYYIQNLFHYLPKYMNLFRSAVIDSYSSGTQW